MDKNIIIFILLCGAILLVPALISFINNKGTESGITSTQHSESVELKSRQLSKKNSIEMKYNNVLDDHNPKGTDRTLNINEHLQNETEVKGQETKIEEINTTDDFNKLMAGKKGVVVKYGATWCGACHQIMPTIEELASKNVNIKFVSIDVETFSDSNNHDIKPLDSQMTPLPQFKFYNTNGKEEIDLKVSGGLADKIKESVEILNKIIEAQSDTNSAKPKSDSSTSSNKDLFVYNKDELENLISKSKNNELICIIVDPAQCSKDCLNMQKITLRIMEKHPEVKFLHTTREIINMTGAVIQNFTYLNDDVITTLFIKNSRVEKIVVGENESEFIKGFEN